MRAIEIVGVGAVVGVVGRDLFAALFVFIPVIKAVLFVGVDMALFFLAASAYSKRSNKNECNLKSASPAHRLLRCEWKVTVVPELVISAG